MLPAFPVLQCLVRVALFPYLDRAVLVVKSEVAAGEPPFDGSPNGGASTPAVGVAAAVAVVRIVNPVEKRPPDAGSVSRNARPESPL